ncbi:MAG: hypothetical protein HS111_20970 [Kofleriaceae bacterium]|nr:hypothetical protein [Kofleriaceae bacterium]
MTALTELQSTGGPVSQDLWTNQEVWVYDALKRVATAHHQYFAAGTRTPRRSRPRSTT